MAPRKSTPRSTRKAKSPKKSTRKPAQRSTRKASPTKSTRKSKTAATKSASRRRGKGGYTVRDWHDEGDLW
jgi:hypothetical protein